MTEKPVIRLIRAAGDHVGPSTPPSAETVERIRRRNAHYYRSLSQQELDDWTWPDDEG